MTKRFHSIDIFRAVTMLLMIFVNDVSGVRSIPAWIEHTEANADGMGFADTIFPAFLFIVGLSLPLAITKRWEKREPFWRIALYIITRSAALIIMGFFHVNLENYSSASALPRDVWAIFITLAFFLIWLDYPKAWSKLLKYLSMTAGIILLLLMAWLFKGGDPANPSGMKPEWWGILGIIGWAYLVCASVFLIVKGRLLLLLAVLVLFVVVNIMAHTDSLPFEIPVLGDASSATLIMAGTVLSLLYNNWIIKENKQRWLLFLLPGLLWIAAGFIIRPYAGGISKIYATPAWVFICIGISILAFGAISWLVDIKGKYNWFAIIRPAGTSTLMCYLLPYILYSVFALTDFNYPDFFNHGWGGIVRSFAVGFFVIIVAGLLEKIRIRLKI